ncbi:MAG TPA: PAS domain S-box protein [Desulfitobacteriaceae bacterium]|nr:PAS domain S-box protein [Desulfitobacteriaceae bacterium]
MMLFYKCLVDNSSVPIYCCDKTGRYIYVNQAFASPFKKQPEDIIGKRVWDIFSAEEGNIRFGTIKDVFETGKTKDMEVKYQDGTSLIYFVTTVKPLKDAVGNVKLVLCTSKDITAWKLAEKALRESEDRLKTIINNTPHVAIQSYDEKGMIKFINRTSELIFGWVNEEVAGKTLDKLDHDKHVANKLLELLEIADQTGKPVEAREWTFNDRNNMERSILSTIFPLNIANKKKEFICLNIDISEKKRLEKEMQRLEQLNLIGQIAAGIGHEVRNPMTTVRGLLQLLGNKNNNQKDKEFFDLMIQELDRANLIITEFLTIAKNKTVVLELKNLNSVISVLRPLIDSIVRESDQDLKLDLGEIPDILIDEKEIRQLILNLAKNGIEAMVSGGCLTIKTYQQNNEVVLEVQDEGVGINSEIIKKIGVPFFTTKENGTGLGLAMCYSIAARQNAKIAIESTQGKTVFSVSFEIPF